MATIESKICDVCHATIDASDGATPTRIYVQPKCPPTVGIARDEHDLCDECTEKLYAAFPKFEEALRLVRPVPVPAPAPQAPELDTVSAEGLLEILAAKLGVKVKRTPDE